MCVCIIHTILQLLVGLLCIYFSLIPLISFQQPIYYDTLTKNLDTKNIDTFRNVSMLKRKLNINSL